VSTDHDWEDKGHASRDAVLDEDPFERQTWRYRRFVCSRCGMCLVRQAKPRGDEPVLTRDCDEYLVFRVMQA
jgi:hypothetical protein